jgi:alpha-galactosidase
LDDADLEALADVQVPAVSHSASSVPLRSSVFPLLNAGWQGRPALAGDHEGSRDLSFFELQDVLVESATSASILLVCNSLRVRLEFRLTEEGLLTARSSVTNTAAADFTVAELNVILPLPARARELLDFTGRWVNERRPQRRQIESGTWLRESRHGRPGHDASFVSIAGTPGFGFRAGEVWGIHCAWSGNQRVWVESQPSGVALCGVGEAIDSGEIRLASAESYSTPWVFGSWSADGLDGMSERFHGYVRRTGRPVEPNRRILVNTWEAVYFDHDDDRLRELATLAAEVGIERFVLDDGWMSGRVNDASGLGDWTVDRTRRPQGLEPLINHVVSLGMDFGLWVEPEMLNLDSETARAHPDWILSDVVGSLPLPARNQYVVDLRNPAAFEHVLGQLDALLSNHDIAYLKWDHNRDLLSSSTHEQTLAVYRLFDELLALHPKVEIESCASGGGRVDLGILERTVRVWPSDTIDALERQAIYRWTSLLLPPEYIGAHVGAAQSHTTGRTHSLSFRLATALFGWAGVEWNLTTITDAERASVAAWVASYKELRPLLHGGRVVRADRDDALWVHGIVAQDSSAAVFSIAAIAMDVNAIPGSVRFPGLDPDRRYRVRVLDLGEPPRHIAVRTPDWLSNETVVLGRVLGEVGIAAPPLAPEQAVVVRFDPI